MGTGPRTLPNAWPASLSGRRPSRLGPGALPYLLALPIVLYEGLFVVYPIVQGLAASFQNVTLGAKPAVWVGLKNYQRMFSDEDFLPVVLTTLGYMVLVVTLSLATGLGVSLLLNKTFRGRSIARAVATIPWAFPDVPAVLVFLWMFSPLFGVANVFARALTGADQNYNWFQTENLARFVILLISTWKAFPFYSLVMLAALQGVPTELYEAVRIDGGNLWQSFRHVTLPALRPTIGLLALLAAIFSFRSFTFIYLLTNGGPNSATETLVVHVYNTAFQFYDYSYGATWGVTGFVVALALAVVYLALQRRAERAEGR
jgi:multiple sugar transport system permease protein